MSHPSDTQIQHYIYEEAGFLRRFFMKLHLRRCPECRARIDSALAEKQEQRRICDAIRRYEKAGAEAEKTMHLPKI
jgi:hypothetical protein